VREDLENKPSGSMEEYLGIAKRRIWWFFLPFFLAWAIVFVLTWLVPRAYRSDALILVQTHLVSKDYVTPNVSASLTERMQSMAQQVLGWAELRGIIERFELYKVGHERSPDALVNQMRKDIHVQPLLLDDVQPDVTAEAAAQDIKRAPPGKQVDAMAFRISYTAPRPELAQQVTDQLVSLFIEGNRRASQQQSEITTRFLDAELQQMRVDLDLESKRISDFKSQYAGELPGDKDSNVLALASFQRNLETENDALNRAEQKKLYLESLSSGLNQSKAGSQLINELDQQLQKMTAQRAELQGRYTDQYPDLKNLRDQIAQVERLKAEAERQGPAPGKPAPAPALPESSVSIDPQLSSQPINASTAIYQLDAQSKANKKEIADRHADIISLEKRIAALQLRLNSTPGREDQLSALTRTYDQSLSDYNALLAKKSQAQLAASLVRRQEGEQFTVLQAPTFPMTTDFPNKLMFSLAGLGAGLVFGIVTATLAELLDSSIHSDSEIQSMVTAPILAGVPHLSTEAEKHTQHYQRVYMFAGALMLLLTMAAGTLFNVTH